MRSGIRSQLLVACCLTLLSCGQWRRGETVLIPNGYAGWVTIEYNLPGAPALTQQNGHYLIAVDAQGKALTSTPMETGLGNDQYFYTDASGKRTELRLSGTGNNSAGSVMVQGVRYITVPQLENQKPRQVKAFFVGSESEYARASKSDKWLLGNT